MISVGSTFAQGRRSPAAPFRGAFDCVLSSALLQYDDSTTQLAHVVYCL